MTAPNVNGASQTLIEDQQANIKTLSELNLNQAATIAEQQTQIEHLKSEHEKWDALASQENERLQAQVKELESPVLPDDVAELIGELEGFGLDGSELTQRAADMLKRQGREIASLKLRIDTEYIKTEVHEALMTAESSVSQQRIEELEARVEEYRLEHNRNTKDIIALESQVDTALENNIVLMNQQIEKDIEIKKLKTVIKMQAKIESRAALQENE